MTRPPTPESIVFVGPTLPAAEVEALLPGAAVAPPVALGDVLALALARRRPPRIAIIDGYFERMAAVWHKEIAFAIERGIEVWGAASMGALRAAELADCGMRGLGAIYRMYARGELEADDEVAVAHLPAEFGFRPISDALVNLRHGLERAPELTRPTRRALIELARARFYRERSWPQLIADGREAGLPARQLAALARWRKPDLKADDARRLLRHLARTDRKPRKPPRIRRVPRTWAFERLVELVRANRGTGRLG